MWAAGGSGPRALLCVFCILALAKQLSLRCLLYLVGDWLQDMLPAGSSKLLSAFPGPSVACVCVCTRNIHDRGPQVPWGEGVWLKGGTAPQLALMIVNILFPVPSGSLSRG